MVFVYAPLLAASLLIFVCLVSGLFSARVGFSFLLVFLLAGGLAGEDGPGGYHFDDFRLSFWVGNLALAVILLDGGLRTRYETFRTGLKPALRLATVGVGLTAALTGAAAMVLMGLDWRYGLLLGAIVGSTDAAAVFSLLKTSGVTLNERVAATLEIESGMNDPMAVYLTLAAITLILADPAQGGAASVVLAFLLQFGLGAVFGVGGAVAFVWLLRRLPGDASDGGLVGLLLLSGGLAVFAAAGWVGGSGFLAVYLFGLLVSRRAQAQILQAMSAMDGYAWLSQAGMFLLLGLLVTPSRLLHSLGHALAIALVLMAVARPLAVWACLAPMRFSAREVWFISWVGLRGAVPIVLAVFPLMAGVPNAMLLFDVAFVVVLASLLLQGSTIGVAARRLQVVMPEAGDELRRRVVFGDFVLDGQAPMGPLLAFYGLPPPLQPEQPLGEWLAQELGKPPVAGDQLRVGAAVFSVRSMEGERVSAVGLRLDAPDTPAMR